MNLSYEAKVALAAAVVAVAAGACVAKYGSGVSNIIFANDDQPKSLDTNPLPSCPPGSVNVASLGETAHDPDFGLAPSGNICSFGR